MKLLKKVMAAILVSALSFSIIACGRQPEGDTESRSNPEAQTPPVADTTEYADEKQDIMRQRKSIDDGLPDVDLNGEDFNILVWSEVAGAQFFVEAENGDIVNDSVYRRCLNIEERFNIKLKTMLSGTDGNTVSHTAYASNLVLSGDSTFNLYQLHSMHGPELSMRGGLLNLYDMKYIDFDKPWWPEFVVGELTLMNQLYVFANPMTNNIISGAVIIYFNRDLVTSHNLENPYEIVNGGSWTLDKQTEITKGLYSDLNGDGKRGMEDRYGYATFLYETYYGMASAALDILKKTDDSLTLTVNNEKTANYIEKMNSFYWSDDVYMQTSWSMAEQQRLFAAGQAVFAEGGVSDASMVYRDTDINFGLIPMPKYDERQEAYITMAGRDLYGIPVTVKNAEHTALIIEALSAEGYKDVLPTYYEYALKEKYMRDEEHYEEALNAVDIIEKSLSLTFWYMYGDNKLYVTLGSDLIGKNNTDFASYYASSVNKAQARLDTISEFFSLHK